MIKKLLFLLMLFLGAMQNNHAMIVSTPKTVTPPLKAPVLVNSTDEAAEFNIVFYYLMHITTVPFGLSQAHTDQATTLGPKTTMTIQPGQRKTMEFPMSFQKGKHRFAKAHIVGLQLTANSASHQELAINEFRNLTGTPYLQIQEQQSNSE